MLTVSPSPLVAAIVGSDREHRLDLPQLVLDASASYDPDASSAADKSSFTVRWGCVAAPSHADSASVVAGPLQLSADVSSQLLLAVPSALLQVGATYTCTATLTDLKDPSRHSAASISVSVLPAPALPTPLVTILHAPASVSPDAQLVLQSSAVSMSATPTAQLQYSWRCTSDPALNLTDPALLAGTPSTANLILKANTLLPAHRYEFQVSVRDPLHGTAASAGVSVYVNAPPFGGSCTVEPRSGFALDTVFELSCAGWQDPQNQLPFAFQFAYRDESLGGAAASGSGSAAPQLLGGSFQRASVLSTQLPSGSLRLLAFVRDGVGATATFVFPFAVPVALPALALADPACYVANMTGSLLSAAVQQQDSAAAFLVIQQLAGVLNTAPANASSACGGDDGGGGGGGSDSGSGDGSSGSGSGSVSDLRNSLLESLSSLSGGGSGGGSGSLDLGTATLVSQSLASLTSSAGAMANNETWALSQSILQSTIAALAQIQSGTSNGGGGGTTSAQLAESLGTTLSALLVDCSRLDSVGGLTQSLLSAQLGGSVAGQSQSLNTSNLLATATRSDLSGGSVSVALAGGVSVALTAAALAQLAGAHAHQSPNASTFGTAAAAAAALALDTRIVQLDARWLTCRNGSAGGGFGFGGDSSSDSIGSALTQIDITLSNGQVVDLAQLQSPITFFIPIAANATRLGQEQAEAAAAAALAAG